MKGELLKNIKKTFSLENIKISFHWRYLKENSQICLLSNPPRFI